MADMVAMVGRVECLSDPDQALILTGLADGFASTGFSIGVDLATPAGFPGIGPASRFLWRTEFRRYPAMTIFLPRCGFGPTRFASWQSFLVTSLALTF